MRHKGLPSGVKRMRQRDFQLVVLRINLGKWHMN
jgi:hypothetical protein